MVSNLGCFAQREESALGSPYLKRCPLVASVKNLQRVMEVPLAPLPLRSVSVLAAAALVAMLASGCGSGGDSTASGSEDEIEDPSEEVTGVASITDGLSEGSTYRMSGVSVTRSELDEISAGDEISPRYGAVLSPPIEAGIEGDSARYQNQVQYLVNKIHDEGEPKLVHLVGARYVEYPGLSDGLSIFATVLVVNRTLREIENLVVSATVTGLDGDAIAEGDFELPSDTYGVLGPKTMMLANIVFQPALVVTEDADLVTEAVFEADLSWDIT